MSVDLPTVLACSVAAAVVSTIVSWIVATATWHYWQRHDVDEWGRDD